MPVTGARTTPVKNAAMPNGQLAAITALEAPRGGPLAAVGGR
jgi:hypothetical protein